MEATFTKFKTQAQGALDWAVFVVGIGSLAFAILASSTGLVTANLAEEPTPEVKATG